MRISAPALCLFTACGLAACSGSTSGSTSGDSGAPPAPNPNEQTVSIGPIEVDAGEETTVCIVVPFGVAEEVIVNSIDIDLAPGSHHLILYQTQEPLSSTPRACIPFAGIASGGGGDTPLVFANREQETWTFPKGLAQEVPANTNVKIEAHYINTTAAPIQGHGQVTFHTTPKASAPPYTPVSFIFWGSTKFSIPPNASASTDMLFQQGVAGSHLFVITTHQHRLGTGISVWESSAAGQMGQQIADDTDWSNPPWSLMSQQYDFDGTNGLTFQCKWTNTTNQTVTFGESALDEMCFIGGYYYPSKGLDFCLDGNCNNR
jgi:hypothetical protein